VRSSPGPAPFASRIFRVDSRRLGTAEAGVALEAAARAVADGALIVMPTETVYGIGARPDDHAATGRLFAAKRRPRGLNLPVLCPDAPTAWDLGAATSPARLLSDRFWPGPLTIVLPRTERSAGWDLGDERTTIGLRVPDHPVTREVLARSGPLAVTSANLSGRPPVDDLDELLGTFGTAVAVYLVVPRPEGTPTLPSTVVDLTGGSLSMVRAGAIEATALEGALSA
jgi:L-threonylcarbamoyladenylate synthase